jgi:CspA family cold shock protein
MSSSERSDAGHAGRHAGDRAERSHSPDKGTGGPGAASSGAVTRLEAVEGKVKWFDPRKGFGFLVGPEGQDIFVHYSIIQGDGFRVLKDGSTVQYDAEKTDKGWKATACKRVEQIEVQGEKKTGYTRSPRR